MSDRISVLIATFNSEQFLPEAIESALQQDIRIPLEIIVLDDGSTDKTKEICGRYPQITYIYQDNKGPAAARNRLIREMTGNFAAFLDADDIWVNDKLSKQYSFLKENPEVPYVGCLVHNFNTEKPEPPYWDDGNSQHYLIPCLIRKEILEKTGFFCENFRIGEDTEYRFRMRELGIIGEKVIPEVLLLRRRHKESLTAEDSEKESRLAAVLRSRIKDRNEKC